MWIKGKREKNTIFIFMTVIMLLILFFIIKNSNMRVEPKQTVALEKFYNSESFEIGLYHNLSDKVENATDVFMRWWKNPESSEYYFFVPKGMQGKELYWIFSKDVVVYIEDKIIEEYSKFDLTEGRYDIKTVTKNEENIYPLKVIYTSEIATFFFETESGTLDYLHENKENREMGNYSLLNSKGKLENAGLINNIHGRGNSAWVDGEKKSYQVTLENKAGLLSMPESKKWLLLANAYDDTLMRNEIVYSLSEDLGFSFTPESEYIEVYSNGNYLGLYSLTEKVEIGNSRVNIRDLESEVEQLNGNVDLSTFEFFMEEPGRLYSAKGYRIPEQPSDISGGYLLELELLDRYGLEASGFITSRMQGVVFNSPKYASYEQVLYVANIYQDFEDAVYSEDGYSPYTGKHFSEYIDVDSFAKKYLIEELVKNLDASFTSQFLYKPDSSVSDKIFAGPVWDYDKAIAAYGVTDAGIDLHVPGQIYVASEKTSGDMWYGLCQQESFMNRVKEEYKSVLVEAVNRVVNEEIPTVKEKIYDSAQCNIIRWNGYGWLETTEERMSYYDEKITEQGEFLLKRMAFLGEEWGIK